jgi:hypothetical protein
VIVLRRGDPRRQKLDAIQQQLSELVLARGLIDGADLPADELRAECALAERGLRQPLANIMQRIRSLKRRRQGPLQALIRKGDNEPEVAAFFAFILGEGVIADRLFEVLSSDAYEPGLTAAEHARRSAELDAALAEQLFAEELEAYRLEADGGVFVRRRPSAALDIDALFQAWDRADPKSRDERSAAIPEYRAKADDGSAPEWMQGDDGSRPRRDEQLTDPGTKPGR